MNPFMKLLRNLTWLTQLGVSLIAPVFLCICVGFLLQHWFSLGAWILVLGIVVGMGASLCSAYRFGQMMLRQAEKDSEDAPEAFNLHE